jgi:iron(III) transport system permease protein
MLQVPFTSARLTGRRSFFCVLALGATVAYPAARLLFEAFSQGTSAAAFHGAGAAALRNTILISLASVAASGVIGTTLALVLHRYAFPGARCLAVLAYLPFTLPPLVGVLAFYYLIGRDGILPRGLDRLFGHSVEISGAWAILLIHTYSFYVFFYASVAAALEQMDYQQIEAARTLGAGPVRRFRRVLLPQLRPALRGAALLTFMSSAASFSAPYFFGHDFPMLSVQIFNERSQFNNDAALGLTLALACVALLGVAIFGRGRPQAAQASKGAPRPMRGSKRRFAAGCGAWMAMALLLLPHVVLLWLSFIDQRGWHAELIPTAWTLDNFRRLIHDPGVFAPIRNSLWMSALASVAAALVSLPAAYLIGRRRPGARIVNMLVMLPWALPGSVIAMNLIAAFNTRWLPLYNTVWLLPLDYFVRNVPLLTRMTTASVESFDIALIEAARSLGAPPAYCLRRIILPLIAPVLLAGAGLVFASCLGEFVASILLYVPANLPIAIKINMEWRAGLGVAFAYSVLLMALVAAAFALARRFTVRAL